ncbi:hypothetical protein BX666DRAFT_1929090 [Dichotomocladium elegans]|nr:hypothetical protein BX666DRAFT_1929090 [Dichotomocladium elegans]
MSLQSLVHREGWKSQTLAFLASAQVLCRSCLSRQFPSAALRKKHIPGVAPPSAIPGRHYHHRPISAYTFSAPHRRTLFLSSTATIETGLPEPVRTFRKQLYQSLPEPLPKKKTQPLDRRVQVTIARRMKRNRVIELYYDLKKDPQLLKYLTTQDLRAMAALLMPPSGVLSHSSGPALANMVSDTQSQGIKINAYSIISDLIQKRPDLVNEEDISWLVPMFINYGDLDSAAKILREHIDSGHRASEATFTALVAGFARGGQIESATTWLQEMARDGYTETNSTIVCALVDGSMKSGNVDQAEKIARECWNESLSNVLARYGHEAVENGQLHDARRFYQYRAQLGLNSMPLLSHISNKGLHMLRIAPIRRLLYDTIQLEDWEGCGLVTRKLLHFYLQRGNLVSATKLWKATRSYPNVFGKSQYTNLVESLAKAGYHEPLMQLYRDLKAQYPDALTVPLYNECLRSFVRAKAYKYVLLVFSDMKAHIPASDMTKETFYAMYALCARTGRMGLFQELLEMARQAAMEMDFKTMSSLMACYLTADDVPSAIKVFEQIATTHGPDAVDYNLLIRATAQSEGGEVDFSKILKILQHMNKMGIEPTQSTYRTLLSIYSQGDVEDWLVSRLLTYPKATRADEIFLNNIALTRQIERNGPLEATRVFLQNDRRLLFNQKVEEGPIRANGMTYKLLMDALSESPRNIHVADKLYRDMKSKGWAPYLEVYENLILGWSRKGRIQRARRILQDMERDLRIKADVRLFTMIADGLLLKNKRAQAREVISEMESAGVRADDRLLQHIEQFNTSSNSNSAKYTSD